MGTNLYFEGIPWIFCLNRNLQMLFQIVFGGNALKSHYYEANILKSHYLLIKRTCKQMLNKRWSFEVW